MRVMSASREAHMKRIPNIKLQQARNRRGWSQVHLAAEVGTTQVNISRWENGETVPSPHFLTELCKVFGKRAEELGFFDAEVVDSRAHLPSRPLSEPEQPYPPIWNVPPRSLFFVGRKDALQQLHDALTAGKTTVLTEALSGLGGIGKTLTAIEYAYQYRHEYNAVMWVQAETQEQLVSGFVSIAHMLNLPEKKQKDSQRVIDAVKRWMQENPYWLLILDNVEDIPLVQAMLPTARRGHILLTTRTQATGNLLTNIELDDMPLEEGALLLLRRSGIIEPDAALDNATDNNREAAEQISHVLGGLPLALEQAGGYIAEMGCSLSGYLDLYRLRRAKLLEWKSESSSYPASVATTWSLSFEKVEQLSPAAADLLRLCAFLSPDAIPEGVLIASSDEPGTSLQQMRDIFILNEAIGVLRRFSFVRRDPDARTLSIHRLVQAVLMDKMDEETQRQWAERTVSAVLEAFVSANYTSLVQYGLYVPHAQTCAGYIQHWHLASEEAADLLFVTGSYLRERAWYTFAEPFCEQALEVSEQVFGQEDIRTLNCLTNLAILRQEQERYTEAEQLFQEDLARCHKIPEIEPHNMASALNNLAQLYRHKGQYLEAEHYYLQALAIRQDVLEPEHPHLAISLNGLATLYTEQGKYEQAQPLYQQALAIRQNMLEPDDLDLAISYNNLANNYVYQRKHTQAEPLSQQALAIYEEVLGKDHPLVAQSLDTLAEIYAGQGKYAQVESLYQRALAMREKLSGLEHTDFAQSLTNLGALYENQGKLAEAEPLYQRALTIVEKVLGMEHPTVARILKNYQSFLRKMGREDEAMQLAERILVIEMKGSEHSHGGDSAHTEG
jgi:tetratricopeptide (TPR) repeat protein/DNA-binding XRE family transcriptional regulator